MSLPTEITFNGKQIQLLNYQQLEQLSRQNLKLRSKTLQEQLADQPLPPLAGQGQDLVIDWILSVQCAVCMGKGLSLTPADFGAPMAANEDGFFGRGEAMPQKANNAGGQWSHSKDVQARAPMGDQSNVSSQAAYEQACHGAAQARQRNQGSNIFG